MKKFPIIILSIWLFSFCALAQKAEKVDEYGSISCDDYLSRLDAFAIDLQEKPNSTGVVIIYEGKYRNRLPIFGYAQNRMWEIKKHYEYRKVRIPKSHILVEVSKKNSKLNYGLFQKVSSFQNRNP